MLIDGCWNDVGARSPFVELDLSIYKECTCMARRVALRPPAMSLPVEKACREHHKEADQRQAGDVLDAKRMVCVVCCMLLLLRTTPHRATRHHIHIALVVSDDVSEVPPVRGRDETARTAHTHQLGSQLHSTQLMSWTLLLREPRWWLVKRTWAMVSCERFEMVSAETTADSAHSSASASVRARRPFP